MVRLELFVPIGLHDAIVSDLCIQPGVVDVNTSGGESADGKRRIVTATVARESLDSVIDRLKDRGIDEDGSIYTSPHALVLSARAKKASDDAPGASADSVVWEELAARTSDETELNGTYFVYITVATLLAAIAILTDSLVTLVGAMVVGPEFGPLTAIALGIVARRWDFVRRGAIALVVGFAAAMLITGLLVRLGVFTEVVRSYDFKVEHPMTDYIYEPGPLSFIVALLAGIVGLLSFSSNKSTALVGAFVSATTIPAAGYVAVASVFGAWSTAAGSALQLVLNLGGIVLAGVLVMYLRRAMSRRDRRAIDALAKERPDTEAPS